MTLKWILFALLQFQLLATTLQSIAGVTYMDHFDFEERYRDVNECNPFYWHPLHMPEDCANMYEKLIRSRIASKSPVRIFRNRDNPWHSKYRRRQKEDFEENVHTTYTDGNYEFEYPGPVYELFNQEVYDHLPLSPYEKMMALLEKDVLKQPSAPTVQMLPGLGPAAVYRQPVSSKTEGMIKRIAKAYAKAGKKPYKDFSPPFAYSRLEVSETNLTKSRR